MFEMLETTVPPGVSASAADCGRENWRGTCSSTPARMIPWCGPFASIADWPSVSVSLAPRMPVRTSDATSVVSGSFSMH